MGHFTCVTFFWIITYISIGFLFFFFSNRALCRVLLGFYCLLALLLGNFGIS
ncbi:hypothetical protein C2G38_2079191 [Gigaspora rosea]|uniref:Uncharacterized protein n=1 Tax=Gigaspora rosea TaxID=44941 RepID=A0A397VGI9_9GLOM|nr:hypothetical protein C2G38_2079191 [Gigaspora rosea]